MYLLNSHRQAKFIFKKNLPSEFEAIWSRGNALKFLVENFEISSSKLNMNSQTDEIHGTVSPDGSDILFCEKFAYLKWEILKIENINLLRLSKIPNKKNLNFVQI